MRPIVITMNAVVAIFDIVMMVVLIGAYKIIVEKFTVIFIKPEEKNYE
jgi:hypothetical protein